MVEKFVDLLLQSQNQDGGWGVVPKKHSQTEVSALAMLALNNIHDPTVEKAVHAGVRWLAAEQYPDGSWPLTTQVRESSWSTSFAVLALAAFPSYRQQALRGAQWLLQQKGYTPGWRESLRYRWAPQTLPTDLNPHLQGWSWTPNSFSWVEPTSYTLIALKKLKSSLPSSTVTERIGQGELLLHDRMCEGGGWNYGNAHVLGERLQPYPDTTAVALIALQGYTATETNQLSLQALRNMLTQVESGLTLSWTILCFSLYGQDASEWKKKIIISYEQTNFLNETKTIALALLALGDSTTAFRV